jgi:hypothetical protein
MRLSDWRPNGCELSGPAFMINEEARSPWNELQMLLAFETGSAPARIHCALFLILAVELYLISLQSP